MAWLRKSTWGDRRATACNVNTTEKFTARSAETVPSFGHYIDDQAGVEKHNFFFESPDILKYAMKNW